MKKLSLILYAALIIHLYSPSLTGVVFGQGMPPAKVVVSEVAEGMIAPQATFVGTVYFSEVSDVAAEVEGKVEEYLFEEGRRVKKGELLVVLNSDILQKAYEAARANLEQALSDLEKAERDLARTESLYADKLVSQQRHDDDSYRVKSLRKKAASIRAEVQRMEIEIKKKRIMSPFDGIVLDRDIDRGEWVNRGAPVATIARLGDIDVRAEVPVGVVRNLRDGMNIELSAGDSRLAGTLQAVIPRGDISSRTFPVKIKVNNTPSLMEGMQLDVTLPTGAERRTFVVPRDAVIKSFGMDVIFAVNEAKAMMIPVKVAGYSGMRAGIEAKGLAAGMKVVVKGNERLRNGQAVEVVK